MKYQAVTLDIHGIKCDTPKCIYKDMSVPRCDYPQWVNRPCPICGGNLLTEKDMKAVLSQERLVKITNVLFYWTKWLPANRSKKREYSMSGIMDGSGRMDYTEIKGSPKP